MNDARETYWQQGAQLIQACLDKAVAADPAEAPMPLTGADAALWHRAQMEAYRHALEMMAPPTDDVTTELLDRTNATVEAIITERSDPHARGPVGKLIAVESPVGELRSHVSKGGRWPTGH